VIEKTAYPDQHSHSDDGESASPGLFQSHGCVTVWVEGSASARMRNERWLWVSTAARPIRRPGRISRIWRLETMRTDFAQRKNVKAASRGASWHNHRSAALRAAARLHFRDALN
jgi:hypothetical protein